MYEKIKSEARAIATALIKEADLSAGGLLVVGCSSSEIMGERIGKGTTYEAAEAVFEAIFEVTREHKIYIAAQCCEHLNRALIIEREYAEKKGLEEVNVIPQPKAGGSFATVAYKSFVSPVAVEAVSADAGIDIGDTFIGMHLKRVAVPVRLEVKKIGEAHVTCARTRPKFIGGIRAVYKEM